MAISIRPFRRFPVVCPVTYEPWFRDGDGIVWNLSPTGWRMSGNVPLQCGDVHSFNVILPINKPVSVAAGIVRWVRGDEFGIETLVMDEKAQVQLNRHISDVHKNKIRIFRQTVWAISGILLVCCVLFSLSRASSRETN